MKPGVVLAGVPDAETLWWVAAAGFLAAFAVLWAISLNDPRMLDGASRWAKPMKFCIATALHFGTLALVVHYLSGEWQASLTLLLLAALSIAAAIGEVGYIAVKAGQLEASHFNVSTPFHALMFSLMALGAVAIVAASGGVGLVALIDSHARLAAAVRLAVGIGLIAGTALTLATAFRLGANMNHHVGAELPGAARMPLTGWSLSVGDLRPAHFFATHMMQSVPLAGVLAARVLPGSAAIIAVLVFALLWSAVVWITFQDALAGRPINAIFAR
jgi:hypothetical protein